MEQHLFFALQATGITVITLLMVHKILVALTPTERRLNRPVSPLPPSATVTVKPRNNGHYSVVVGGSGCLGTFIARQLVARGDKVRVFDVVKGKDPNVEYITGSIMDEEKLTTTFQHAKVVFHAASVMEFVSMPRAFDINVIGTQHVINACIRSGVTRLVYTSSVGVLMDGTHIFAGDENTLSYSETHITPYGTTKALAEKLVLKANGTYGLRTCALRPPGMFGPGDQFFSASLADPKAPLIGGPVIQDWMYVENSAHCHILAADSLTDNSPVPGKYYFISDGGQQCHELCNKITRELGYPDKYALPRYISYPLAGILQTVFLFGGGYFTHEIFKLNIAIVKMAWLNLHVSTERAAKDLNYKPICTLQEGITRTVADLHARKGKK